MANTRLIKRRIKSAQNISQITRAMEMVAASKMKKAQDAAVLGKPYADKVYSLSREFARHIDKKLHPLLSLGNPQGKLLLILISTNKGLCGGLNTNLFRMTLNWLKDREDVEFISVGKRGQSFVIRNGKNLLADFSEETPFTKSVPALTKMIVQGFVNGEYGEVYLAYNTFLTALKQLPFKKLLLPISALENAEIEEEEKNETSDKKDFSEFLIEPSADDVLAHLLPHYLENQIRAAILEAEASEHSARMIAMKNATDAARDLTAELTLIYNKARQEKITNEIADIVTAREVVE